MQTIHTEQEWTSVLQQLPGAHILQTWQWGQIKAAYGWTPTYHVWRGADEAVCAAALVLERAQRVKGISTGLRVLYIPRGPHMDWSDAALVSRVLNDLQSLAQRRKAIFIKIDPEVVAARGIPGSESEQVLPVGAAVLADLAQRGWQYSSDQIQFRNTAWLDLHGSESDWQERMKPKARYNLRLASKKGVTVRLATEADYSQVYRMYAETSVRDGFVIRPEAYYQRVWSTFISAGLGEILLAEVEGEVVAGLALFYFGEKAWYLYGMSRTLHREKMPNYLLQWEAMRLAQQHGVRWYDLWGAPDVFDESDSMWGVFRFKEGLGAEVIRTLGAWDFPARPGLYRLYTQVLPKILSIMRRRGKERTRQEVSL